MPWCPQCKSEYREGFTVCADCHVELVDELPEEPETDEREFLDDEELTALLNRDWSEEDRPVLLVSLLDDAEAGRLTSYLESYNIPVFPIKKSLRSSIVSQAETELYVPQGMLNWAIDLLHEDDERNGLSDEEAEPLPDDFFPQEDSDDGEFFEDFEGDSEIGENK